MSNSLQPHGLQHIRPPCPSPTPRAYSNSCPSSRWCHPTISSSVVPFSSHLQSVPASRSFQMSQLFAWGGQSTGDSATTSVFPMNIQDWFPLGWTGWMASPTRWTGVWVNSGSWWWTGRSGVLQSMGSQRFEHDWVTELNWQPQVLGFSPLCHEFVAFDLCNLKPVSFPLNLSLFICKMKGLEVLSAVSFCAMKFNFYI